MERPGPPIRTPFAAPASRPASGGGNSSSLAASEDSFQEQDPARAAQVESDELLLAQAIAQRSESPVDEGKVKERKLRDSSSEDELVELPGDNASSSASDSDQVGNAAPAPPLAVVAAAVAPAPAPAAAPALLAAAVAPLPPPAPPPVAPAGLGPVGGPPNRRGQAFTVVGAVSLTAGVLTTVGSGVALDSGISGGALAGFAVSGALFVIGVATCLYGMIYRAPPPPPPGAHPR